MHSDLVITMYIIKFGFESKMMKNNAHLEGCYLPQLTTFSEICRILPPEGGGDTPLYKPYRYMTPQRVWFLSQFGLKTGIHFAHFGLESRMVFEGTAGAYKLIYFFNSK